MVELFNKLQSWVSKHNRVRKFLLWFGLGVLLVSGAYAVGRIFLFVLGTVLQFWYRYTQNLIFLWSLTILTFAILGGFGYLLWVRRAEFLRREAESDAFNDVYGGFGEDE